MHTAQLIPAPTSTIMLTTSPPIGSSLNLVHHSPTSTIMLTTSPPVRSSLNLVHHSPTSTIMLTMSTPARHPLDSTYPTVTSTITPATSQEGINLRDIILIDFGAVIFVVVVAILSVIGCICCCIHGKCKPYTHLPVEQESCERGGNVIELENELLHHPGLLENIGSDQMQEASKPQEQAPKQQHKNEALHDEADKDNEEIQMMSLYPENTEQHMMHERKQIHDDGGEADSDRMKVNSDSEEGDILLYNAARQNKKDTIFLLPHQQCVQNGAGDTPLSYTSFKENQRDSQILASTMCDPNTENTDTETALHIAVKHMQNDTIVQLLSCVECNSNAKDREGNQHILD